jgi:uncharacterized protein (TIGR03084 family)
MAAPDIAALCDDLEAEHAALDAIVAPIGAAAWESATPAERWTVRDEIHHLGWFDRNAALAIEDRDEFAGTMNEMIGDFGAFESKMAAEARSMSAPELLEWWRAGRERILRVVRHADPSLRVPWYGPPMALASFVTARLMETWAHGQDVVDALGARREPTARLKHIAHIGVRTRGFSYAIRDRQAPEGEVFVSLTAPDGSTWTWGDAHTVDRVSGPALDFCLVVTQRRHVADTSLQVEGRLAQEWMSIAQAFAGGPGEGRKPGQFAET